MLSRIQKVPAQISAVMFQLWSGFEVWVQPQPLMGLFSRLPWEMSHCHGYLNDLSTKGVKNNADNGRGWQKTVEK